ncbi:MAG: CusA/CzcA family heavy metal efflux RND transporter, partial [Deltaproteobacteria bacterium]|nr:CusA/CzcA family heavy metal efflux RND transporter [Deltaproteobacteria bacterium]
EFSAKNKFLVLALTAVAVIIAIWCTKSIPLDALPDLSDTQVIVYSRWDRSPDIIEDQVTYPIITAMLGAPKIKDIRGFSDFGFSYVYLIFEDGTDIYWARSRVLEYLSKITSRLPEGVKTEIGPDATGLGWVYQYALVDESGQNDLSELRSYQDWHLRYQLQSVQGVAEVATVGGQIKQYQVNLNPSALLSYNIPVTAVMDAVRMGNNDVGGRLIEFTGREYMIRGRGYIKSIADIEKIAVGMNINTGAPVLVKDIATVSLGPDIRRGVGDLDGRGDTVSGIVIMRSGENALNVIERVKQRIEEITPSLPKGMKIVPVYDRSDLINRAIETLKKTLIDEMVIVSLVILLFLWHIPSAITAIITIPVAVLLAFIPLYGIGVTSNIMSLAGIAISIGVLVDGAIIEVENLYQRTQLWLAGGRKEDFGEMRLRALKEVGPSVFFSLLVIGVSFLPIFTLVDQEGRLFKPLAYSKNLAMFIAAILAVTMNPAIRMLFSRYEFFNLKNKWLNSVANHALIGKYYPEEKHPISQILFAVYEPACRFVLKHRKQTLIAAALLMLTTIPLFIRLGSEFMPPLNEGAILYMPTTLPGISVTEAQRVLTIQDQILKSFPEVERVYGKVGRADTPTDPAPFSMAETVVVLRPEKEWRKVKRWYSFLPPFYHAVLRHVWSDHISMEDLINEMDAKMQFPGWTNAWTMPIKNRVDMLSTGIRTPIGIKLFGSDIKKIEELGKSLEVILKDVPGTRSVYAERVAGGYFLDFELKREALGRFGISVDEANAVIAQAIGGENVTTTIEGRERYPVNVRYARELRDDVEDLRKVLVPADNGAQVPLGHLADIRMKEGPSMIRDENGSLSGYVYIDIVGRDPGGYIHDAKKFVAENIKLPPGYTLRWSGSYENMLRVRERLKIILPLTLLAIFFLLYLNTKSAVKTGIVMLAVPFSLIGAVWFLTILDYNMSIAVWVGMIALMGLDAETGVFMLLFLDLSYKEWADKGQMRNKKDLEEAVIHGAVKRVRPKLMTVAAAFIGLLPIMWSMGAGSDVMKRIAAPMIGGLLTSFLLELLIYPVLFSMWKEKSLRKSGT